MSDLPIRPEALDAACTAYDLAGEGDVDLPEAIGAAIAEFCRVEGLTVESMDFEPIYQRLVGPWRGVDEALRRTQERYRTSREEGDYATREEPPPSDDADFAAWCSEIPKET